MYHVSTSMGQWGGQFEMMWDTGLNVQGWTTEGCRNWVRRSRLSEESGIRGQAEDQQACQPRSKCTGNIWRLLKALQAGVNSSQWPADSPTPGMMLTCIFQFSSAVVKKPWKCHQAFGFRTMHNGAYTWHRMVSHFPQRFPQWAPNLPQTWQIYVR